MVAAHTPGVQPQDGWPESLSEKVASWPQDVQMKAVIAAAQGPQMLKTASHCWRMAGNGRRWRLVVRYYGGRKLRILQAPRRSRLPHLFLSDVLDVPVRVDNPVEVFASGPAHVNSLDLRVVVRAIHGPEELRSEEGVRHAVLKRQAIDFLFDV